MNLHEMIMRFVARWAPENEHLHRSFVAQLRMLLETYGRATLKHKSLPDTEHKHGEPV